MPNSDTKPYIPPQLSHLLQATTLHLGVVRDVKDPEGRGRVKVECPTLNHTGNQNWMNWCEPIALSVGSVFNDGDCGMWWPYFPGQAAYVGFKDGDYLQPYVMPGPAWAEEPKKLGAEWIPKEAKAMNSSGGARKGTRVRVLKSEAGHSILMDDNGQQEAFAVMDWTGAGLFIAAPGKEADDEEKEKEASKYRKGEKRGTRSVAAQTSATPGEITQTDTAILGLIDLNGQGVLSVAKSGDGKVVLIASNEVGGSGPCLVLDAKNNNAYLGAGDAQIHLMGDDAKIMVTKQMIKEVEPIDLDEFVKAVKDALKNYFEKYEAA